MTRSDDHARARRATSLALFGCALLLQGALGCGGGATAPVSAPNGTATGADPSGEAAPEAPASGPSAPGFSLPTLDGGNISLSDYQGDKVVLVDFWSTSCDPCLREMPELIKLYKERKDQGFEILAISVDAPETMSQVSSTVKKVGMIFPVLLDSETEVMDRYNPKGEMPFTVVIDKSGSIVLKRSGYQPGDRESWGTLVRAIDQAMGR